MKISQELATDLRFMAERLEWTDEDKAEVKRCLKADSEFFMHFLSVWAMALRKGYKFSEEGRYVRMADFCLINGLPDPYRNEFTDKQVDQ